MALELFKYRDSIVWTFGVIAAVVVGLATLDTSTAVQTFGIPETWLPYIRLAAFIIGIVSAQLGLSPLKKKPVPELPPDPPPPHP
jgi:ABC-type transport system substrate-binding protein